MKTTLLLTLMTILMSHQEFAQAEETEEYMYFACSKLSDSWQSSDIFDVIVVTQETTNFDPRLIRRGSYGEAEGTDKFTFRHYSEGLKRGEKLTPKTIRQLKDKTPDREYILDGRVVWRSIVWETEDEEGDYVRILARNTSDLGYISFLKNSEYGLTPVEDYDCRLNGARVYHGKRPKIDESLNYDDSQWKKGGGETEGATY